MLRLRRRRYEIAPDRRPSQGETKNLDGENFRGGKTLVPPHPLQQGGHAKGDGCLLGASP